MTDLVVDGTVVEEHGTDLVEHQPHGQVSLFGTSDPTEVLAKASEVAGALRDVLQAQGMIQQIKGKGHVKLEGWQTLGSMLGVTAVIAWTREIEGGWEARAEARTLDGRIVGAAEAMCTQAEGGMWSGPKQANARRAMAQTRALSRALRGPLGFVVTLAGYQATAAEEMPHEQPPAVVSPAQADGLLEDFRRARDAGVPAKALADILTAAGATDTGSVSSLIRSLPASGLAQVHAHLKQLDKEETA